MTFRKIFTAALAFAALSARAEVKLPPVIADHMVIQRDKPVHLWGWADPNEKVHAEFRGNKADTTAGPTGGWEITLPKGDAGGPFVLTVNSTKVSDILVGDVWFISGQSNVEYSMGQTTKPDGDPRGKGDLAAANFPKMRILVIKVVASATQLATSEVKEPWAAANSTTLAHFSAVGFYFARDILADQKVPIGMIEAATGGSAGEAWISPEAIKADPSVLTGLHGNIVDDEEQPGVKKDSLIRAAEKRGKDVNNPGWLYNGMIFPLTPIALKGIIWYHGASNTSPDERAKNYGHLISSLIVDWRKHFYDGSDLPFLTIQLANRESKSDIAACRDGQFHTLELPHTGLPVTVDIGDPKLFHPPDKMDIGYRTALWARAIAYGETGFEYSGPLFAKATPSGNKLTVTFTHNKGLMAKGGKLTDWEVAGKDLKWKPAEATIQNDTVVVTSPDVAAPLYVRYDYSSAPPTTLYNAANLPAAPFTSKSE